MMNKAMQRKLRSGDCLDVRKVGEEIAPGIYQLREFQELADYCDAEKEAWIWSIGRHDKTGIIYASLDARFYQHPEVTCLFLR